MGGGGGVGGGDGGRLGALVTQKVGIVLAPEWSAVEVK